MHKGNEPKDYIFIKIWGELLGSYPYYINVEQKRAAEEGAPLRATYYSDMTKRWHTIDEVQNEARRNSIIALAKNDYPNAKALNVEE